MINIAENHAIVKCSRMVNMKKMKLIKTFAAVVIVMILVIALEINRLGVISGTPIFLYRAKTTAQKAQGLGKQKMICARCSLLFDYERPQEIGIWMKDMQFPIDIIWLNADKKIIHIEENVAQDSYPKTYKSEKPASSVLELNAGFVRDNGIKEGQSVWFWN